MKIELKKTEKVNGETWYHVFIDGSCDKSFFGLDSEIEAIEFFKTCKENANRYPIETIIDSFEN